MSMMVEKNKRVLVGMSGGIDSTATCLMLKEQGPEVRREERFFPVLPERRQVRQCSHC